MSSEEVLLLLSPEEDGDGRTTEVMLLTEGPWRKFTFQGTGHPTHHACFPTLSGRVSSPFPSLATSDHMQPRQ